MTGRQSFAWRMAKNPRVHLTAMRFITHNDLVHDNRESVYDNGFLKNVRTGIQGHSYQLYRCDCKRWIRYICYSSINCGRVRSYHGRSLPWKRNKSSTRPIRTYSFPRAWAVGGYACFWKYRVLSINVLFEPKLSLALVTSKNVIEYFVLTGRLVRFK